jgi:hypothetical protein
MIRAPELYAPAKSLSSRFRRGHEEDNGLFDNFLGHEDRKKKRELLAFRKSYNRAVTK